MEPLGEGITAAAQWVPDGDGVLLYYYEMNTDGNHYSIAPLICSLDLESDEDLGSGYVQRTLSFYRGFSEENIPTLAYGATMGSSFLFYDYYTGFLLPDNDYFADGDGSYYYEFDTPEGLVELAISVSSDWRDDVERYHYIRVDTITIAAPDWYDGLVMVFPTQPDTWEESKANNEVFSELDDYERKNRHEKEIESCSRHDPGPLPVSADRLRRRRPRTRGRL